MTWSYLPVPVNSCYQISTQTTISDLIAMILFFLRILYKTRSMMKKVLCCRRRKCKASATVVCSMYKYRGSSPSFKNEYNQSISFRRTISAVKLIRTDTTLDLSQKAKRAKEKKKEKSPTIDGGRRRIYTQKFFAKTPQISQKV